MTGRRLAAVHPGEVLREEFLEPLGLSQSRLARDLGVPPRRANEVVLWNRGITADTALRLARCFDTSASFWPGLQMDYEIETARYRLGRDLKSIPRFRKIN